MSDKPDGLLNLDKPAGVTSRDVVNLISRPLRKQRVKVGHAGTLDPLATGVLVVCVGRATRLIEHVQRQEKVYRAVIRLGATSDTLDAAGCVEERVVERAPMEALVRDALAIQVGAIEQIPPGYSALKVGGIRSYRLARAGLEVELAPRRVEIHRIELIEYAWPRLTIEVECGGGTYIRSVARDVGLALGCGGLIEELRRTRIGPFRVEDSIPATAERLEPILKPGLLLPSRMAVMGLPRIDLDDQETRAILRGQAIRRATSAIYHLGSGRVEVALFSSPECLVGVGEAEVEAGEIRPRKVLMTEDEPA